MLAVVDEMVGFVEVLLVEDTGLLLEVELEVDLLVIGLPNVVWPEVGSLEAISLDVDFAAM